MLITIGNTSVSAKDVKRVSHYFSTDSQKGFIWVLLSGGEKIEETFNSEPETEANSQSFIEDVNLALKDWL
jgi:hypothetical protein